MTRATFRQLYPPPWRVLAVPGGFRVVSSNNFSLAFIYCQDGIARSADPNSLRPPEALAMAKAIAALGGTDER